MKQYTKNWFSAFFTVVLIMICLIFAFLFFTVPAPAQKTEDNSNFNSKYDKTQGMTSEEFIDYADNVGAVTFTEDQITELARNMYYLDGFLSNINVQLEDKSNISLSAKIKSVDNLLEEYPELEGYKTMLAVVENKQISVKGKINDNSGLAGFEITSVNVGSIPISPFIVSPFIEEGVFYEMFDVNYDSIEIDEGIVVFKNGLPDILKY